MRTVEIAVWTIVLLGITFVVYKFIINPQIIVTPSASKLDTCPARWSYDPATKLCKPDYATSCKAFDPTTITTMSQACRIANSCGTNWSGFCS